MPTVTLHTKLCPSASASRTSSNVLGPQTEHAHYYDNNAPLPNLLRTPYGLALLEIQGTLNIPSASTTAAQYDNYDEGKSSASNAQAAGDSEIQIGRLVFTSASAGVDGAGRKEEEEKGLLKKGGVHFYVGKRQRLVGEVKKLPRAVAVVGKRGGKRDWGGIGGEAMEIVADEEEGTERKGEELEIVDVVRYKIVFSGRPEFV